MLGFFGREEEDILFQNILISNTMDSFQLVL